MEQEDQGAHSAGDQRDECQGAERKSQEEAGSGGDTAASLTLTCWTNVFLGKIKSGFTARRRHI